MNASALPDELWRRILETGIESSKLNYKDVCSLSITCTRFNRISNDDSLWSSLFFAHFHHYPVKEQHPQSSSNVSNKSLYKTRSLMNDTEAEIQELRRLQREVDLSETVMNFLAWQERLKVADLKNSLTLRKWCTMARVTELHRVFGTNLKEYRLSSTARRVVRGIIKFFFDLFEKNKVPVSLINQDKIHVRGDMTIWVAGLVTHPLSDDLRNEAINKLLDIIRSFVGENLPKDVEHLLECLEESKTIDCMKVVALMHPSMYDNFRFAAFIQYMYQLYMCNANNQTSDLAKFKTITYSIPPYCNPEAQWVNRIRNDASGSATWNELLNLTISEIGQSHQDFDTPIGILILLGSALAHASSKWPSSSYRKCGERTLCSFPYIYAILCAIYGFRQVFQRALDVVGHIHEKFYYGVATQSQRS
ncbi:uncharacterized protein LOC132067456 isoform X1 [Lycium ferocissimum]|uniref:uncharacterized protein LOC132067456 isoform X1 n=1 Tax=Lycium ferocissimum TaxID=112874 RepID=UPI002814F3F3|nr:uncharacterized protein LOC132067456 isoform X1 [Lycium ferocissimum]